MDTCTCFVGTRSLKQLDKIANGADNVATAAGLPRQGGAIKTVGDDCDGQGTNDAANADAQVGQLEATLPEATFAIPGRKLQHLPGTSALPQLPQGVNSGGSDTKFIGDVAQDQQEGGQIVSSLPQVTQVVGRKM